MRKPSQGAERVGEVAGAGDLRANHVGGLETLGALQQIELHSFALVQSAVAVLLDGREMNENVLPCGALDKSISFSPVEPLDCTLLSHKILLSPLQSGIDTPGFSSKLRRTEAPPQRTQKNKRSTPARTGECSLQQKGLP